MHINEIITEESGIDSIISKFKLNHPDSIEYGCIRDNCGVVASDFVTFAEKYGFNVSRVGGYFLVDNPSYAKKDFTPEELNKMRQGGYNPNSKKDRKQFAKENNLNDELKRIPHYWNEYQGNIIDFSAKAQFVDTGMAADANQSRYINLKK
jgi:hypothetical protein